jgi:hypothetical protein
MKHIKLFEQFTLNEKLNPKIVTVADFHDAIKLAPELEEYKTFMKESGYSNNPFINGYFEDGDQHYPAYPLIPFKYFNIKGYLTPIYWGSATSGNIATRLFSDPQILNGYVIFGENMGSKDRGSYGTGQGFIRPYGNSRDNDRDSEWQYIVSLSTASKYLNEKYWTKVPSSLGFYEYLTLDSSAVSALKRESKKVLGNFYAEVIDKMVNDSEFIKWKSGGDNKKGKIVEVETLEDKLKALQTDDYQNRKGNYPKDGVADTIQYWDNSLSFEFKNTDERGAERWVKNFLSGKNLSPKKIKAEQTGDYRDDWVTVTANFK